MIAYQPIIAAAAPLGALLGVGLERLAAALADRQRPVGPRTACAAAATALYCALLASIAPGSLNLAASLIMLCVLLPAALVDLDTRRIPNQLTVPGLVAILAATAIFEPLIATERLLFALLAFSLFLGAALLRPGALGLGDVKLVAVIAAALGAAAAPAILLALLGGTFAGLVIAARRGWSVARSATLPLAPFLAVSSLIALLLGG